MMKRPSSGIGQGRKVGNTKADDLDVPRVKLAFRPRSVKKRLKQVFLRFLCCKSLKGWSDRGTFCMRLRPLDADDLGRDHVFMG